jgi:hypothetical protein
MRNDARKIYTLVNKLAKMHNVSPHSMVESVSNFYDRIKNGSSSRNVDDSKFLTYEQEQTNLHSFIYNNYSCLRFFSNSAHQANKFKEYIDGTTHSSL